MPVRIAMAQILVEGGAPEANLARAETAIAAAAERCCRVVVLPECLDLGWTDDSAHELAEPIPGSRSGQLAAAARAHGIWVCAGLVERAGERRFNSAVLIDPDGALRLHHRKIHELAIGHHLYDLGDRLGVVDTDFGRIGVSICADNAPGSLTLAHALAHMGASILLSPSSWAVPPEHDNAATPYGGMWLQSYQQLSRLYGLTVIGVSNVGWLRSGPWRGHRGIGNSIAVGPDQEVLAIGPHGVDAEALIVVEVEPRPAPRHGDGLGQFVAERGYQMP